jgi:hypothetical protein
VLARACAHARTVIAIAGLAFAVIELAGACLDHFDELHGLCSADSGVDCGDAAAVAPQTGSGSGK